MKLKGNEVITFYRGDYGVPIAYTATGFAVGDKIVFCTSRNTVAPKVFGVDALDEHGEFTFDLSLSEPEARAVAASKTTVFWSFKHCREGVLIDTLATGSFEVRGAVEWRS